MPRTQRLLGIASPALLLDGLKVVIDVRLPGIRDLHQRVEVLCTLDPRGPVRTSTHLGIEDIRGQDSAQVGQCLLQVGDAPRGPVVAIEDASAIDAVLGLSTAGIQQPGDPIDAFEHVLSLGPVGRLEVSIPLDGVGDRRSGQVLDRSLEVLDPVQFVDLALHQVGGGPVGQQPVDGAGEQNSHDADHQAESEHQLVANPPLTGHAPTSLSADRSGGYPRVPDPASCRTLIRCRRRCAGNLPEGTARREGNFRAGGRGQDGQVGVGWHALRYSEGRADSQHALRSTSERATQILVLRQRLNFG